jgi:hypothetical protein
MDKGSEGKRNGGRYGRQGEMPEIAAQVTQGGIAMAFNTGARNKLQDLKEQETRVYHMAEILSLFGTFHPEKEDLSELKKFWGTVNRYVEDLGSHISKREQSNAHAKCAVCGDAISRRPAGILPGFDPETGIPVQLYVCTQTCFQKAQVQMEKESRKRLEARGGR